MGLKVNKTKKPIHLFVDEDDPFSICGWEKEFNRMPADRLWYDPKNVVDVLNHASTCEDCAKFYRTMVDPDGLRERGHREARLSI